jgi:chitinase
MVKTETLLLFFAGLLLVFAAPRAGAARRPAAPVVVGYVFAKDAVLAPGEIDAQSLTRINFAFANIANGRMVEGYPADAQNLATLTALRRQNPALTVLVSVGGWLWSTNFSDVALTPQSRQVFVQSVIEFLQRYDLDGLDIDWEYPGLAGSGHPFRSQDKQNFTLLLRDMRQRFDREAKMGHRRLYLTIAAGASEDFLAHTEMKKAQRYLDTVNLMAYDFSGAFSDATTSHHAPLYANPASPKKDSVDEEVRAFLEAGVPAAKLVLGVPFYGHAWGEVSAENHGLFQPGKPTAADFASYGTITTLPAQGFVRYWDAAASAPYIYSAEKKVFITYEDPQSLGAKCSYIKAHKLAGVMFWQYSGDPSGELLKTIREKLLGPL